MIAGMFTNYHVYKKSQGFSSGSVVKNLPAVQETQLPWVEKIPMRRAWQPVQVLLPGEFQAQRSLAGYSPGGRKESDTTE